MARPRETVQTPGRARRSAAKRAAVLDAAEVLFVDRGYASTSVDAVAARAGVSKRTLYDHFGDKQAVLDAVLARAEEAVTETVRTALDEELDDGRPLREGLVAFVRRVVADAFPSSAYRTVQRLGAEHGERPDALLEARIAELAAARLLDAPDPRRAAQHLTALTFLLVLRDPLDDPIAVVEDGVDAFLRAYAVSGTGTRRPPAPRRSRRPRAGGPPG